MLDRTKYPNLGFGKIFAPKMIQAFWSKKQGWSNFEIVPFQNISLHPGASVIQYGQSIFEGLKVYLSKDKKNIRIFRADYHSERFNQSAQRMCLPTLPSGAFEKAVADVALANFDYIPDQPGESLYLRPSLFGTEGFLGVRPAEEAMFLLFACPVGAYYSKGFGPVKILIETEYSRAAPGGVGFAKTGGNYAASLIASERAKKSGHDQVLWLDAIEKKYIEEVGTMNIFFRFKNEIVTPPLSDTILAGCTRDTIIRLLAKKGTPVTERKITLDELVQRKKSGELQEAFGTGTAAIISSILLLETDDQKIKIDFDPDQSELGKSLFEEITKIQTESLDYPEWVKILK
jgi:branched-chain amino acid aminotransferase